ncbi:MAG TPA: hypothetical protein VGH80_13140 [Xanthomonadaceae bacterium]|jgi:hypothetical protein
MPSSSESSPAPSPLADLLGCDGQQRDYDSVIAAAGRCRVAVERLLGPDWWQHYVPAAIAEELGRAGEAASHRTGPRRDKSHHYGLGLPVTFVALGLPLPKGAADGWTILQSILLAGVLLRNRTGTTPGRVHIDAIAQFLTSTEGATSDVSERLRFIRTLSIEEPLAAILATLEQAVDLPKGFKLGLAEVIAGLQRSRRTLPGRPKEPKTPGPTRPPSGGQGRPVRTLQDDDDAVEMDVLPALPLSKEAREHAVDSAEAVMEQVAATLASLSEAAPDQGYHEREALAKRQFLDLRHALWAPEQWDALTGLEMCSAVRNWLLAAETAAGVSNLKDLESALLTLLVGLTGWKDETVWTTPIIRRPEDIPPKHRRAVILENGSITFPVPQIGQRYDPHKKGHGVLVVPVATQVTLRLPDRMVELLRRYSALQPRPPAFWLATELGPLRENVRGLQKEVRLDEPRETLARLRNAHALRLINFGQDLPLAQMACGELLGVDDVALSYVSCPAARLQALCGLVWEAHGYGKCTGEPEDARFGGSQLQIADETAHRLVERIRTGLSYGKSPAKAGRVKLMELHTALAAAVAWLLCAGLGLRPNARLGKITSRNFSMRGSCLVAVDKVLDEGHLGRLVPLPPTIAQTILAYGRHLEALSCSREAPSFIKEAARAALGGAGPLFFIPGNGRVEPLSLDVMRKSLPHNWMLPVNVFRHRISTALRGLECPGVYAEALLGHIELGIQPFGSESFMDPLAYLATTSRYLEDQLKRDGWAPLQGLAGREDFQWEARPLGNWVLSLRQDHETSVEALRSGRRQDFDSYRDEHWDTMLERVDQAIQELLPAFETSHGGKLDRESVLALRTHLTEAAKSQAESRLLVEALRARLVRARDARQWKIARLPFFHTGPVEPSPFHPDYPAVLESFLQLRQFFVDVLNGTRRPPRPMTARTRLILALILWHGVADWDRLTGILSNLHRARPVNGLDDAVMVPVPIVMESQRGLIPPDVVEEAAFPPPEVAEILRGPLAAAAASFVKKGHPITATAAQLGIEIGAALPIGISNAPARELLPVLLEAARIVHLFEHAPPMRDVWANQMSSLGLPAHRIDRLFTTEPIHLVDTQSITHRDTVPRPTRKRAYGESARTSAQAYRLLRDVLRVPRGKAKKLPLSGTTMPVQTEDAAMRHAIAAEVDLYLAQQSQGDGLCQLLGQYARQLLTQKGASGEWLRPATPYGYAVHAGACLVSTHPNARLLQMEAEELFGIYRDAIRETKKRYQPWVARYLSYFHAYLVQAHEAPSVDLRSLGGSIVGLPEVGFVTPREYQAAVRTLSLLCSAPGAYSTVEGQQATQAIALGYATGARTSEVNLRERRDLVVEDGRSALLIRGNRFTGLKTRYSARVLSLEGCFRSEDLERIKDSNAILLRGHTSSAPLFPDTDVPDAPTDPDVISRHIGQALRSATGEPAARQYWLRHNAASMELLALFGDEELISAVKRDDDILVPFPQQLSTSARAQWLGGSDVLSQIHAAAFRARRGHSTMRTSITTYVHTINLIEPTASRAAMTKLTSKGVGSLADRSDEWVRQTASRSGLSMKDASAFRKVLVKALAAGKAEQASAERPAGSAAVYLSRVRHGALARGVECYFRSGELDGAVQRMGLSPTAARLARSTLEGLGIQPTSRIPRETRSTLLGSNQGSVRQAFDLRDRMIDASALEALLATMRVDGRRKDTATTTPWELILGGADVRDQVIRCRTPGEIVQVFDGMSRLAASAFPSHRAVLVVPTGTEAATIENDIRAGGLRLAKAEVVERNLAGPRSGFLPLAVSLQSQGRQIRLSTLLVAAVTWSIWSALRRAT